MPVAGGALAPRALVLDSAMQDIRQRNRSNEDEVAQDENRVYPQISLSIALCAPTFLAGLISRSSGLTVDCPIVSSWGFRPPCLLALPLAGLSALSSQDAVNPVSRMSCPDGDARLMSDLPGGFRLRGGEGG